MYYASFIAFLFDRCQMAFILLKLISCAIEVIIVEVAVTTTTTKKVLQYFQFENFICFQEVS